MNFRSIFSARGVALEDKLEALSNERGDVMIWLNDEPIFMLSLEQLAHIYRKAIEIAEENSVDLMKGLE